MPLFDLPLEQLRTYGGRSSPPQDHGAYWDRALSELESTDPAVELRPASFAARGMKCADLWFSSARGGRVHCKVLEADDRESRPALLMFHGYSGSSGDWMDKLAWVHAGFRVFAMDCRGQGGASLDCNPVVGRTMGGLITRGLAEHPDQLYFRQIFLDTARLADIAMGSPGVDRMRVYTMGGSQGGALALVCAALRPAIARTVSIHPFLSDYRRVWEMDLAENAYEDMRSFLRQFDPRHEKIETFWHTLGYIDIQHLMQRVQAQVLLGVGLMDRITPPSTVFAAYNKIEARKDLLIYPDFGHEHLPGFADAGFRFLAGNG